MARVASRDSRPPWRGVAQAVAALAVVGCRSAGDVGPATAVDVLDDRFVVFDGERMPHESFFYAVRSRTRAARSDPVEVVIRCGEKSIAPAVLARMLEELQKAGVGRVTVEGA